MLQNYSTQLSAIEQGDYLSRIIKTVENMRDLLDNVLFLGRADSQLMQFSPKNVNLSKLCRDIVEEIHLSASQKREIDFKIEHCESYVVLDETLVRHILYNLLSNAIKYSKDDRKVIFRLNNDCEKTDFVVQDFGIGIPEEEQNKIFEAFHRARNVGTISGTGIGMTIVLRSLELLGGRIEFTSRLNVGTTFKVTIPTIKL
jgi:signal transduction histidine kinase